MKRLVKSATQKDKLYIRFGDIPEDRVSKIHRGDTTYYNGDGVSVWEAVECNGSYFPLLSDSTNKDAIADYFYMLFSDRPIYLVKGTELQTRGFDNEPLLDDIEIVRELTDDYAYIKEVNQGSN